jgi:putative membrane protein
MSLAWHPHVDVWLMTAALLGGYLWAVRRVGPRFVHPVERPVSKRQAVSFVSGVLALWVASDWPVHELSEGILYSVHMVQHILMIYVAPPLLLAGMPAWMWRWILGRGAFSRVARVATKPLIALVFFNLMVALIHVPVVVDTMIRSEVVHFSVHAVLVASALCMWTPVLSPLIELPALAYPTRMFYLFLQSLVPTVPASFLTFGETVLYRAYADANPWGFSALTDQRIAGLIMKIGGGALLWGFIAVYFFRWFALEDREGVDVLELERARRSTTMAGN